MFAKLIIVPDDGLTHQFVAMFLVLRDYANLRSTEELIALADLGISLNDAMRPDYGPGTDGNMRSNNTVGLYFDILGQLGIGMNYSGFVDVHGEYGVCPYWS